MKRKQTGQNFLFIQIGSFR